MGTTGKCHQEFLSWFNWPTSMKLCFKRIITSHISIFQTCFLCNVVFNTVGWKYKAKSPFLPIIDSYTPWDKSIMIWASQLSSLISQYLSHIPDFVFPLNCLNHFTRIVSFTLPSLNDAMPTFQIDLEKMYNRLPPLPHPHPAPPDHIPTQTPPSTPIPTNIYYCNFAKWYYTIHAYACI